MKKIKEIYVGNGKKHVTYELNNDEWFTILKALEVYADTSTNPVEYNKVMDLFAEF